MGDDITGSIGTPAAPRSDADWRRSLEVWGARYRENPSDAEAAIGYAAGPARHRPARPGGRRAGAVPRSRNPHDMPLLGAYGRALADAGDYNQALDVLGRAHTPGQSGLAHPQRARRRARSAGPPRRGAAALFDRAQDRAGRPVGPVQSRPVLRADQGSASAPRRPCGSAVARPDAAPKVRQNLALVVGLQGRFAEAEKIARADLPPIEAAANVGYLRQMLAQHERLDEEGPAAFRPRPTPGPELKFSSNSLLAGSAVGLRRGYCRSP